MGVGIEVHVLNNLLLEILWFVKPMALNLSFLRKATHNILEYFIEITIWRENAENPTFSIFSWNYFGYVEKSKQTLRFEFWLKNGKIQF